MCQFFSFCTEPENHGGKRFYFDWEYRKAHLKAHLKAHREDENDSHSLICKHYGLHEDACNKYEFNPLTKVFVIDQVNSPVNDCVQAEEWVNKLDFKRVVEPLIIKPIVNPFELPKAEMKPEYLDLLKVWDSVWASVGASVWASVRASVWASVGDSVRDSVWDSVGASVWASVRASVWASVWAYISSFFAIVYEYDIAPAVRLWERGIVASFDGTTWRLHSGKKAEVIFSITQAEMETN